ncbi:IgG-binding virulence factor TspB family protein [Neisseria gonorrhoeae]|nr:IgG-binding virulence factor TspB family protein [Neisseria gonorrhoeae]
MHRVYFKLERNPKYKEEMDAKKPEEILSLKVDADPDKYIKATGYPGYSEKVEVAPGTKVNMGSSRTGTGIPFRLPQHSAGTRKATPRRMYK